MMKKATLFFLFLTLFVFQCGKQGPLALEPENPPPAVENLQLRQIGNRIQLEWSFPAALEEGQIPFEITKLRRVSVYYSAKELAADKFRKRAELRARIKPGELRGGDGRSSCAITFHELCLRVPRCNQLCGYAERPDGRAKSARSGQ